MYRIRIPVQKAQNDITNNLCTCCLYGAGRNDFDVGYIHFEGHWKGWALKIETFLGPEMATSEANAIWTQKSRSRAECSKRAEDEIRGHQFNKRFESFAPWSSQSLILADFIKKPCSGFNNPYKKFRETRKFESIHV